MLPTDPTDPPELQNTNPPTDLAVASSPTPVHASNIVKFTLRKEKEPVLHCSFCKNPIVKGKTIQESPTSPAICFDCVKRCSEILEQTQQE